jgi:hypothetical protein
MTPARSFQKFVGGDKATVSRLSVFSITTPSTETRVLFAVASAMLFVAYATNGTRMIHCLMSMTFSLSFCAAYIGDITVGWVSGFFC